MKPWAQLWGQVPSPHQKGGRQGHEVLRLFYPATFASCYRSGWVTLHCHLPCWDLGRSVPFPSYSTVLRWHLRAGLALGEEGEEGGVLPSCGGGKWQ